MAARARHRFPIGLIALATAQVICAGFFISEFLTEVLGLRTWALPFQWREILQILASLGLVLGTASSVYLVVQSRQKLAHLQRQVRVASGALRDVMEEFFENWNLSTSERDVATFAMRGYTNPQIADLRGTSEATIKTQINAIFRKADVSSRSQLLGLLLDALLEAAPSANPEN